MALVTDRNIALERLKLMVQDTVDPVIDGATLDTILDAAQVYAVWAPSTPYNVGDRIIPVTRNGHAFRCVQRGTSGATEPSWNIFQLYAPWDASRYLLTGDNTVRWQEDGVEPDSLWDLRAAAHQAWLTKLGIASNRFQFAEDRQQFYAQQVYDHCKEMAKMYEPIGIA